MRMSCNGCRVLRKGCSENCSIRPCLEWIKSPESQANATVFLAKFYGRAGLLNLVNAGPEHLRPAIFRSLLYEACGRIVNPIYGSVGLLWSGSWSLCQTAVESVLRGEAITTIGSELAEQNNGPPLKAYDIRHVSKDDSADLHRVRTRTRFKKSGSKAAREVVSHESSHESSLSHLSEAALVVEAESLPAVRAEPESGSALTQTAHEDGEVELELELTLGFEPVQRKSGTSQACGSADVDGVDEVAMLELCCSARAE